MKSKMLNTLLGSMMAIGDGKALYLLEFVGRRHLEREIEQLERKVEIVPGSCSSIESIEDELHRYFCGTLRVFKTPIADHGSPFQRRVWEELQRIPYGETRSYGATAQAIGQPTACRAVARANGSNQLAIIVPCHRVINISGELGGYAAGIERKEWLLQHEKCMNLSHYS
jgi:AraC family transcriptional regulator, regulatory protein of adaptative response / methylated-DNA-[protein]-cysteine methyltransferase